MIEDSLFRFRDSEHSGFLTVGDKVNLLSELLIGDDVGAGLEHWIGEGVDEGLEETIGVDVKGSSE